MLYDHQKKIIEEGKEKCGLFLGTGSGKTRTALYLARGSTLVICPKTQRDDRNWEKENETIDTRLLTLKVVSKEEFRRDWATLPPYDTLIIDEAHTALGATPDVRYKNRMPIPKTSQIYEAIRSYIRKTHPSRIYLCTATIVRNPMVVWAASQILGLKWDFYKFRAAFYFPIKIGFRQAWKVRSDSKTKDRLAKAVRSLGYTGRLEDYFDVPPQNFRNEYIELTSEQKERIRELPLEYPDPIVLLGKKHQVENGILAGDEFMPKEHFKNEKIQKLIDYSYEFPKMIVFAKYRDQVDMIRDALIGAGKKVFVMNGDTKDRGEIINKLKKLDDYAFIVTAQISAGWELPECPVMIFASRTYSYVDYVQGLGRIQRVSNIKKNLYINLIVKDGIDEEVHNCLENKVDFDTRIYLGIE